MSSMLNRLLHKKESPTPKKDVDASAGSGQGLDSALRSRSATPETHSSITPPVRGAPSNSQGSAASGLSQGNHSGLGQGTSGQQVGSTHGAAGPGPGITPHPSAASGAGTHVSQASLGDISSRREGMADLMANAPDLPDAQYGQDFKQELEAKYDKQPWQEAIKKTDLAEKEVATAALSGEAADRALQKAQQAERTVQAEAAEHDRLIAEAEQQRGIGKMPDAARKEYSLAQGDLARQQDEADRQRRALLDAEHSAADKQAALDRLQPALEKENAEMEGLARSYDKAMGQREAEYQHAEGLQAAAQELEAKRRALRSQLASIEEKLQLGEQEVAQAERAQVEAKNRHAYLLQQLQGAKAELEKATLVAQNAQTALEIDLESIHGWDRKIAAMRTSLGELDSEHNQLLHAVEQARAQLDAESAHLQQLRAQTDPDARAIAEADQALAARQKALQASEVKAKEAKVKYAELVKLADKEKAEAALAAKEAQQANVVYEKELREADLHSDRHAQLWHEAQMAGERSSQAATKAFEKMHAKVEAFKHSEP